MNRHLLAAICLAALIGSDAHGQAQEALGRVTGVVRSLTGIPVEGAVIELRAFEGSSRAAISSAKGEFEFDDVNPGRYFLAARRLGFFTATRDSVLVRAARTIDVTLRMEASAAPLAEVRVVENPFAIKQGSTEFSHRLSTDGAALLPTGRDAASLIELLPGVSRNMVWGGAGALANNYRLDGLSMTHPGFGGDLVSPAIDWVEAVEVSGLGAGPSYGNFQGGVINAVTKSGTNESRSSARVLFDAKLASGFNQNLREEGLEQASRAELTAETSGPIVRDRLFFFGGGQYVRTGFQVPDLLSADPHDFRSQEISSVDRRGFGKVSWTPSSGTRVEGLGLLALRGTDRTGFTGYDDPKASRRNRASTAAFQLSLRRTSDRLGALDLRVGGASTNDRLEPYDNPDVPGVRVFRVGTEPSFQNAAFTESSKPSVYSAQARWLRSLKTGVIEHGVELGADASLGFWRQLRSRNGGVTWRPFPSATLDPANSATWANPASEWGGNIHLDSRTTSASLFMEDRLRLGRVTVTPGLRFNQWEGFLDPAGRPAYSAVRASAIDPRLGVVVDPLGTNQLVFRGHWGIYHQGMAAALFDRVGDAAPYQDERFYFVGPQVPNGRTAWTDAERDAQFIQSTGQPYPSTVRIRSEAGRLDGYRQPSLHQLVAGAEYTWRGHWNLQAYYVSRTNRDFVGLVDRNLASNYTAIHDVGLGFYPSGRVALDSVALILPTVYVRNDDLAAVLPALCARNAPPPGTDCSMVGTLSYNPDIVFTAIPEARREMRQAHLTVSASYDNWAAFASITSTTLRGNVSGVTTLGGVGSAASAGQWVRPNESIGSFGKLGGYSPIESKLWLRTRLSEKYRAGVTMTHLMGEFIAHDFEIELGRYRLLEAGAFPPAYEAEMFEHVIGQTILVEPLGKRHYADRTVFDLRVERTARWRGNDVQIVADVMNVLASNEVTLVQSRVNSGIMNGEILKLGTPRLRVSPRMLRIGSRIEVGGNK